MSLLQKQVFALAGPTASGKTNLAIKLAKEIDAEIISVDSTLVYKGLDIGSAKPTIKEMQGIYHHLIDIIDPWLSYSVNDFLIDVQSLIIDIQARNKNVLLVGGTMMYFKALEEGISILPEANEATRAQLKEKTLTYWYDFLQHADPVTAVRLNPADRQRIERAVEIILLTNKPYSIVIQQNKKQGGLGQRLTICALVPQDRKKLHDDIDKRFHKMLDAGFLHEVKQLKENPKINENLPAMRSVGYRQAWQYLEGQYDYQAFIDKGIAATRQLAKRQLTWIRNWPYQLKAIDTSLMDKEKLEQIISYLYSKCPTKTYP
ncbi:tRNA (adenosine(37)-N6)-dimethylallyltransferase MiaA [Fastidiosibacter lacustris]|uniref:tRNA (adenosine(37)-N6)-dimethylallyltransferase MiaA n=1 Tax=Fastidiosibacter lacustris TaxID=2056695 RepID=UPI000E344BC2|nr:tRNA (adenosine(37)-N6)-dimethylallyltransferase MiaA [Fastidiosibacter lacustris]